MMGLLCALLVCMTGKAQDPCLRLDSHNMLYCAGEKAQEHAECWRRSRCEPQPTRR